MDRERTGRRFVSTELRHILLAEDNPADLELTHEALQECGLANPVDTVRDGLEVMQYLRRGGPWADRAPGDPLLVLLDLKMPRMDGVEVLRAMKGDALLRRIPVVMLTSSRQERDLVQSYDLGVNAYVVKPVAFEEFVAAVRQLGAFWALVNEPSPEPRP